MKKIIIFTIISFFFHGINFAQKNQVNVYKLAEAPVLDDDGIIYNLPQTKIRIRVLLQKTTNTAGPYAQFAKKMIGDVGAITSDQTQWELRNVALFTEAIPDTNQFYVIVTKGNTAASYVSLTNEMFLESVNDLPKNDAPKSNFTAQIPTDNFARKDLTLARILSKNALIEKIDTIFQQVKQDTQIINTPIVRRQLVEKQPEQKAREIAELIFALRDDKNALLTGEGDGKALPDGKAIELMLKEIDKLEQQYLAFFLGSSHVETQTFEFDFIPDPSKDLDRLVLFKFSSSNGILPANDRNGEAILLEIFKIEQQKSIQSFIEKQKNAQKKPILERGIVYRLPGIANFKLSKTNKILLEQKIGVAQYGTLARIPVEILKRTDYLIHFDTNYGSLIGIQQIR